MVLKEKQQITKIQVYRSFICADIFYARSTRAPMLRKSNYMKISKRPRISVGDYRFHKIYQILNDRILVSFDATRKCLFMEASFLWNQEVMVERCDMMNHFEPPRISWYCRMTVIQHWNWGNAGVLTWRRWKRYFVICYISHDFGFAFSLPLPLFNV